jgi:hypothetical protein
MQRTFAISVSAIVMVWAASAVADSPKLKGPYAFTGTEACLISPGSVSGPPLSSNPTPGMLLPGAGFQADLRPNDVTATSGGVAFSHSSAVEGIRTFNGDGTGSVAGTSVGITIRPTPGPNGYPHFPPGAGSSTFSYTFSTTRSMAMAVGPRPWTQVLTWKRL